jgi:hypothetical protein
MLLATGNYTVLKGGGMSVVAFRSSDIIKNRHIQPLSEDIVQKDLQDSYLKILKQFLGK